MINYPEHGWCSFKLNEFEGTPSYLTNVPVDMLEQFINYWKTTHSLSVFFDEEGSTFTLVANGESIYIIEEKYEAKLIEVNNYMENLTLELVNDIEKDIDGWASEFVIDEEDINENKETIIALLNELKEIIKEQNICYIYADIER